MAENIVGHFKVMIVVMLFYSFAITLLTYSLAGTGAAVYITDFSNAGTGDFETVSSDIEDSLTAQTDIPVLDVGSLVFYSGNILIDLLLNFLYAIPEMLGFLVHGLQLLFNLEGQLFIIVESFGFAVMTALYVLGVIQILAGIRSGRVV